MNDVKLRRCPFCGGEAYFLKPRTVNSSFVSVGVECKTCGANPYSVLVYKFDTDENKKNAVAELWNRRTHENGKRNEPGTTKGIAKHEEGTNP